MKTHLLASLFALLIACESGPDFNEAQKADTIEAYETFLASDPSTYYKGEIDKRLEELYYDKADADDTLASWDAYLAKFPKSKRAKEAATARGEIAFETAWTGGDIASLEKFATENPNASDKLKKRAASFKDVLAYGKLSAGEPTVKQVNLGEDPKGPLNGWGVFSDIKNEGDKTFSWVNVTVEFLGDDGAVLDRKEYALTSPSWNEPATDLQKTPLKAGETRTWSWTLGLEEGPDGWNQKVKVYVSGVNEAK